MDVMKNKKVAYCVDFVTVHHFTKFRSHICNIGDFTEGGHFVPPPPVLQGSKKPGINRVKTSGFIFSCTTQNRLVSVCEYPGGRVLIYISVRGRATERAIFFRIPTPGQGIIFVKSAP